MANMKAPEYAHPGSIIHRDVFTGERMDSTEAGQSCPSCASLDVSVTNSRPSFCNGAGAIRRKRKCNICGSGWHTNEISDASLEVIKKQAVRHILKKVLEDF